MLKELMVRKNIDLNSWSKILALFYVMIIAVILIKYRYFHLKFQAWQCLLFFLL